MKVAEVTLVGVILVLFPDPSITRNLSVEGLKDRRVSSTRQLAYPLEPAKNPTLYSVLVIGVWVRRMLSEFADGTLDPIGVMVLVFTPSVKTIDALAELIVIS
jgi:hypothetical protein